MAECSICGEEWDHIRTITWEDKELFVDDLTKETIILSVLNVSRRFYCEACHEEYSGVIYPIFHGDINECKKSIHSGFIMRGEENESSF